MSNIAIKFIEGTLVVTSVLVEIETSAPIISLKPDENLQITQCSQSDISPHVKEELFEAFVARQNYYYASGTANPNQPIYKSSESDFNALKLNVDGLENLQLSTFNLKLNP
jgi:hypothetical protein